MGVYASASIYDRPLGGSRITVRAVKSQIGSLRNGNLGTTYKTSQPAKPLTHTLPSRKQAQTKNYVKTA